MISCNSHPDKTNAGSDITLTQAVFSVEEISKEEYIQAYNTSADYNIYPQQVDSISQQYILSGIFQDAKERIAELDSVEGYAIHGAVSDDELYCIDNMLYFPDLKLLGIKVPLDYHNNTVWWYDSTTGKRTYAASFEPTAVNTSGIYVCQAFDDCDIVLDLHFYKKQENRIYKIQAYMNNNYEGGDLSLTSDEYQHIFWYKNNMLYLSTYNLRDRKIAFMRITLDL